ncbi:cellulose-binding protein, partial [Nonomuraea turkmeniaca]
TTPSGTWRAGVAYAVGSTVTYNGVSYRCIQAHTSLAGWEPPNVPALWQRL